MKHHSKEPLLYIKDYNYCPFCGNKLLKIEGKNEKVCPEGDYHVVFEKVDWRA
jgi:hypothetical protein